jgi:hypothetical protein
LGSTWNYFLVSCWFFFWTSIWFLFWLKKKLLGFNLKLLLGFMLVFILDSVWIKTFRVQLGNYFLDFFMLAFSFWTSY